MIKEINKLNKALSGAGIDIWESRYVVGGYKMRKEAKRTSKRAHRRSKKALIKEQQE